MERFRKQQRKHILMCLILAIANMLVTQILFALRYTHIESINDNIIIIPVNHIRATTTTRFSNNVQQNIDRGLNIINCWSGQHMAAWIYEGHEQVKQLYYSWNIEPKEKLLHGPDDISKLASNDTIFVAHIKLNEFVKNFLPYINTTFVLITTSWKFIPWNVNRTAPSIIKHSYLLHWFATDIERYTGGYHFHPKVSPFPLGLKPNMNTGRAFQNPIPYFQKEFLKTINYTEANKMNLVFAGQISQTSPSRVNIPSGPRLPYDKYLEKISHSSYVISPDGDHPDCHRHYEAIGLGAIPITQLDPYLYSHLKEARVIYNNSNWNITDLEKTLPLPISKVNRNMIFEEYWMEYVERIVGRPLWWWDTVENKRLKLDMFFPKMI